LLSCQRKQVNQTLVRTIQIVVTGISAEESEFVNFALTVKVQVTVVTSEDLTFWITYFTWLLIPESKQSDWQLGHAMYSYLSVGFSARWLPSKDVDVEDSSGLAVLNFLLFADTITFYKL
jgi:hypothetical protein